MSYTAAFPKPSSAFQVSASMAVSTGTAADKNQHLFKNIQMFRPSKLIMKDKYPSVN